MLDDGKTIASADQIEERLDKIDDWEQCEASVKQILFSTISDRRLLDIQNLAAAALMWAKLKLLHDGKTEIVVVAKRRHLNNMMCQKNLDVRIHISSMKWVQEELAGMGVPVSNVNFCGMISSSLPESYDNLISTLLASAHSSNKPLTPDALIMHIELEADFRDSKKKSKQQKHGRSALVATESMKSKSKHGDKHEDRKSVV